MENLEISFIYFNYMILWDRVDFNLTLFANLYLL